MTWTPPDNSELELRAVIVPCLPVPLKLDGTITRTWMQDRAAELERRKYTRLHRVLWPEQPLRLLRGVVR